MSVFQLQPTTLTGSTRQFVIPPTIQSDYHNYLHTNVPNVVFDFKRYQDWYEQFDTGHTDTYLRAESFPINWKSKMGNSDASANFYTDYDVTIHKGDMVVREDGTIMMLNWAVQNYINAQVSQSIECNYRIDVQRHVKAQADKRGFIVQQAHLETIVDNMPAVMAEYQGRPDYEMMQNVPGVHTDMLTECSVQYNRQTKNIRINDVLTWYQTRFVIVDVNYSEMDIAAQHGVLKMYMKKVAGEYVE